jgi:hypothetical protein
VDYFQDLEQFKVDPYTVFTREESQKVHAEFFNDKVRERDFPLDTDKKIYMNLPKFQPQRDFSNP